MKNEYEIPSSGNRRQNEDDVADIIFRDAIAWRLLDVLAVATRLNALCNKTYRDRLDVFVGWFNSGNSLPLLTITIKLPSSYSLSVKDWIGEKSWTFNANMSRELYFEQLNSLKKCYDETVRQLDCHN